MLNALTSLSRFHRLPTAVPDWPTIFANGFVRGGAWDATRLDTMYQDAAGTVPAPGSSTASAYWLLDIQNNLALGPEIKFETPRKLATKADDGFS